MTPQSIPGSKSILAGPIGSGKTHSIRTLVNTGLEVFCIFTERKSIGVLGPVLDKIHWSLIEPTPPGWKKLSMATQRAMKSDAQDRAKFTEMRGEFDSFYRLLEQLNNFVDQSGQSFGSVEKWDQGRVLVIDSLTGVNHMVKLMLVGSRTNMTLPEVGEAQDFIEKLMRQITDTCQCHFVLTAHIERDKDEVLGGVKLLISTHGNKLGPILPRTFDNFILAQKSGDKFTWATSSSQADLTAIHLPLAAELPPNWGAVIDGWKKLGGVIPQR